MKQLTYVLFNKLIVLSYRHTGMDLGRILSGSFRTVQREVDLEVLGDTETRIGRRMDTLHRQIERGRE